MQNETEPKARLAKQHVSVASQCRKESQFQEQKTLKQFVGFFQESEKCQQSHASVSSSQHSYANNSTTKSKNNLKVQSQTKQKLVDTSSARS